MTSESRSRTVHSSQREIHPRLPALVDAHFSKPWLQPLHESSVTAFDRLESLLEGRRSGLVLDSGCGTGQSTRMISNALPGRLVIGVDKSKSRLSKAGSDSFPFREGSVIWVRAELSAFWRLAVEAGWRLERHYLLYPNPWPKPGQVQRRWHAHPVFPELLKLGGRIEMRCNWEVYAREFAAAVNQARGLELKPEKTEESAISSPFERKYQGSGHDLYSVVVPADRL